MQPVHLNQEQLDLLKQATVHRLDSEDKMQAVRHMLGHIFLSISRSLLKANQDESTVNSTTWK